jgi:tripartite-type tricarboxylate transporter receptor subunit TctC
MTTRTTFAALLALPVALAVGLPSPASAEQPPDYPSRNITYVVPFPAGGVADILARIYTPALADALGKPIVIENRPGASTSLATNSVMRSAPDGYTIMQADMSYAVAPNVVAASYDPVRDLTPVVQIARSTLVLAVNPALPARSAAELVALAKTKPGDL